MMRKTSFIYALSKGEADGFEEIEVNYLEKFKRKRKTKGAVVQTSSDDEEVFVIDSGGEEYMWRQER